MIKLIDILNEIKVNNPNINKELDQLVYDTLDWMADSESATNKPTTKNFIKGYENKEDILLDLREVDEQEDEEDQKLFTKYSDGQLLSSIDRIIRDLK